MMVLWLLKEERKEEEVEEERKKEIFNGVLFFSTERRMLGGLFSVTHMHQPSSRQSSTCYCRQ